MRKLRYHGNTNKNNIYEFLGFDDGKILSLPLNPSHQKYKGKIVVWEINDVVFLEESEDRIEHLKQVEDFIKKDSFVIKPRLLKYRYKQVSQGTADQAIEYAFIYAPQNATFNNVRSVLMKEKYKEHYHEIDLNSVEDLTINYPTF